jgi:hypothetical protein
MEFSPKMGQKNAADNAAAFTSLNHGKIYLKRGDINSLDIA